MRQRLGVALWLLAAGCAPEPPPAEPAIYRLIVGGDIETWGAADGQIATFDRKKRTLARGGEQPIKARRRWPDWAPLTPCLGKPLAEPPGGDPGAFRKLIWIDKKKPLWVLELSGLSRCSASGVITLQANGDKVDVSKLQIDGLPWKAGGMERARELSMGYVQAHAVEWWLSDSDEEREDLLRLLRDDPDPESEAALRRILEVAGPGERLLVESALEYRPLLGPVRPDGSL